MNSQACRKSRPHRLDRAQQGAGIEEEICPDRLQASAVSIVFSPDGFPKVEFIKT